MRRPIRSLSRCLGLCRARREPELVDREMRARGQPQLPMAAGRARQPQVGVPPERHRDRPTAGGDDRRVDRERLFMGDDGDLDAVRIRERRRVHVDRGPESCPFTAGRAAVETPSRFAHEETVDGEAVGVGAEREAGQVDVDAGSPVVARSPTGSPMAPTGGGPGWRPPAAPRRPPGSARCSRPRHRSETPVNPRSGRNVAESAPAVTITAGSPRNLPSSTDPATTVTTLYTATGSGTRRSSCPLETDHAPGSSSTLDDRPSAEGDGSRPRGA